MLYKSQIVADLGVNELLIPQLINEALSANDRIKYFFSLLQMAKEHAEDHNEGGHLNSNERRACGVDDDRFDKVIKGSEKIDFEHYRIPELRLILDYILKCIIEMISPLDKVKIPLDEGVYRKKDITTTKGAAQNTEYSYIYSARLEALKKQILPIEDDIIANKQIDIITSGQRERGDSFHLLVMDLHKDLNLLQSKVSQESIDGANVYGLIETDRSSVKAFMNGVNQTAKLKFEHIGLGTTATRSGEDLIIQNDIGTTDAHVLVLRINKLKVILTCTDIHIQRLLFFQSLLDKYNVKWSDTKYRKSSIKGADIYHLSIGIYEAIDDKGLYEYLSFLGSRIVFLIDWNRARKTLRNFVKKADCIKILKWAADSNYGHIAFLMSGGEQLLYGAIRQIGDPSIHYGQQLDEVLGKERTIEFLHFVIKTCYENLVSGGSQSLIRDRIRAELASYFSTAEQDILQAASDHASLLVEIAQAVWNSIRNQDHEFIAKNSKRARIWESKADVLVKEVRTMTKRPNVPRVFEQIIVTADDAADFLEEAAFLLTLSQKYNDLETLSDLFNELAEKSYYDCMEYLKALENAKVVHRGSSHEDIQDFLEAVDRTIAIEHDIDEINRRVEEALVSKAKDFRQFHIYSQTASNIERSTDSIMKAATALRDYTLGNLSVS
jgi:uncharacterized protein Yka (UPF0111/DUF47 family)